MSYCVIAIDTECNKNVCRCICGQALQKLDKFTSQISSFPRHCNSPDDIRQNIQQSNTQICEDRKKKLKRNVSMWLNSNNSLSLFSILFALRAMTQWRRISKKHAINSFCLSWLQGEIISLLLHHVKLLNSISVNLRSHKRTNRDVFFTPPRASRSGTSLIWLTRNLDRIVVGRVEEKLMLAYHIRWFMLDLTTVCCRKMRMA